MGGPRKRKSPATQENGDEGPPPKAPKRPPARKIGKTRVKAAARPNLATLQKTVDAAKSHLLADGTNQQYEGHRNRGRRFLADVVAAKRKDIAEGQIGWAALDERGENLDIDVFAKAFDDIPNKYSAYALELFMVQKVFEEKLKAGTGVSAYSAFKHFWERA